VTGPRRTDRLRFSFGTRVIGKSWLWLVPNLWFDRLTHAAALSTMLRLRLGRRHAVFLHGILIDIDRLVSFGMSYRVRPELRDIDCPGSFDWSDDRDGDDDDAPRTEIAACSDGLERECVFLKIAGRTPVDSACGRTPL
jgi:hypothetical protein